MDVLIQFCSFRISYFPILRGSVAYRNEHGFLGSSVLFQYPSYYRFCGTVIYRTPAQGMFSSDMVEARERRRKFVIDEAEEGCTREEFET